jgi:uncharacterized membrane protein YhiD involved in acid resistance
MGSILSQIGTDPSILGWLQVLGPSILFSILSGGLIGIERELKNKPAGVKTNILICVGAALYANISVLLSTANTGAGGGFGDPSRVAAQIVSGIGFLGGGTIIQARGTILGLTTAATIWVVAAIGILIGIGYPILGMFASVSVVLILVLSNTFEDRVMGRSLKFALQLSLDDPEGTVRAAVNSALLAHDLSVEDFEVEAKGALTVLDVRYSGRRMANKKFLMDLWSLPGIREVKQR